MKQISLLVGNTLTLAFALVLNAMAGSAFLGGKTVGEVSAKYETLFTPAGYAFAIWAIIYLLLILFVGYQWYSWFRLKKDHDLKQTGIWFAIGNLANGFWIVAWLNESMGISLFLISILLISLIVLTFKLRLEIWDAPVRTIAFVWWPICIYLGWIVVATAANASVFLVSVNWDGAFLSPQIWAIILITVAMIIYLFLIVSRNMREAALVGVWALIAIAAKQWQTNDSIVVAAISAAIVLFVAVSIHGFKNRATSPFEKIKRGEV